jgi:mono/diheme cytochrome c family protein
VQLAVLLLLLLLSETASAEAPRVSYMLHCAGCHGMDGRGIPPEVPTITGAVGQYLGSPDGRRYLVQVPGAAQSLLDDGALAEVLNWILAELGGESVRGGFQPFTAAEVHGYRRAATGDVDALRRRLRNER